MCVTAYGMLLHGYRWKLHYRVATFMANQGDQSDMSLARHWLQVQRMFERKGGRDGHAR